MIDFVAGRGECEAMADLANTTFSCFTVLHLPSEDP